MAPNVVEEKHRQNDVPDEIIPNDVKTDRNYKSEIDWPQLIFHITLHALAAYGAYHYIFQAQWRTWVWGYAIGSLSASLGVGAGAHRYYAHRSYKATKGMEIVLLALQAMAGQNSMYTWARDHRMHHKYSDTDADPHNFNRGFFYAHMGWLLVKKHPLVAEKGRQIDISDLRSNKLLMAQRKYYIPIYIVMGLIIPIMTPVWGWNESIQKSFFLVYCFRYVVSLHATWTINSFAHAYGMKPYDGRIRPSQSHIVMVTTGGDGWHNFHHAFPWDYRSAEKGQFGITTLYIDVLSKFGLFYDLKAVTPGIMEGHIKRHGDGTHKINEKEQNSKGNEGSGRLINFNSFLT